MRLSLLEAAESTVCCSPTIWCCLHPLNKGVNQYALDRFAAGCGQAEAKINTKRPRYYVSPETQVCVLQVCDNTVQPVEKFKNCRGGIHEWRKAEKREWCTGSWGKRSIAWASVPWSQSASFAPNRKIPATLVRSRDRNTPRKVGKGSPFRSPVRGSKETKGRNYISDLAWRRLGMVAAK